MSMKFCYHCGKAVPVGTKYCPYCEYPVDRLNNINKKQSKTVQPRYYQRSNKNSNSVKILLIIAGIIILLVGGGFGIHAYSQHEYYATNYVNLNDDGGKYGYYSDVSQRKFWALHSHYVIVKKNIRAYDISSKGTDMADVYSIGSKILKKGSIVKTHYLPTTPGGFSVNGKGFHNSNSKESGWVVNPGSLDSKKATTYSKSASNYWIKAVRKY